MSTQQHTRREFFRAAVRSTLLGALGLIGAVLLRRQCVTRGSCESCKISEGCELPWKEAKR